MSDDKTIAEAEKETAAANSGENAAELKEPDYVTVTDSVNGEPLELPTEDNNLLGLSTLERSFPGAHGLKYENPATGTTRTLRVDSSGTKLRPPPGGWAGRLFTVIYPNQPTAQRSLGDVRPQSTTTICKCGDGFWFSSVFAAAAVSFLVNFVPALTTCLLEASHKTEINKHMMLIMNGTISSEAPAPDPPSIAFWNTVVTGGACVLSAVIAGGIYRGGECRKEDRTPAGADGNGPLRIHEKLEKCTDQTARIKLELEKADIKKQKEDFLRKEKELADKERLAPWNVDTIGKEAWSKSIVNKVTDKKPASPPKNEDEESDRMMKYFKDNETLLDKYARLKGFDQCEKFLLEHPHLCSEFATSYLMIEALNLAIDEKHDEMAVYAGNCITLQYVLKLVKSLNALTTNENVIKTVFKKIRAAGAASLKVYSELSRAFYYVIAAKAKRLATDAKEKLCRIQESPGGLDPQEVFESLPESMQEAFTSQSVEKLQDIATTMDSEVFQYHLNRCIASGLWVPNAKDAEEDAQSSSKA